ncbi:hypothetical protein POJ06DRAFT_22511 [Lipomyces tetrasporus]|uniref:RRM domain-containing protein n=1 Tax=Lipomyces tetrasporus TaxID=54092 RepID=A0AAD7QMB2_9ASCO|nr:uncharacterized protein POJ06DRAFT_22511 [Lipomyces tetrasporus]KAJ8097799.1 hypothetical protein POJ06DRAFT_22511 [Lipomyces tetrasporus]
MSVQETRTKSTIYISGLDPSVTIETLHYAFIPFGDIVDIQLPKDDKSKEPHRGFALLEFETPLDAESAIDNMNQAQLNGRTLRVTLSRPQKERFDIHNAKIAVWDSESWLQENVVDKSDRRAIEESMAESAAFDPMQSLENDAAGPHES